MGQAKLRGTRDERVKAAELRKAEEAKRVAEFRAEQRRLRIEAQEKRAQEIGMDLADRGRRLGLTPSLVALAAAAGISISGR